VYVFRGFRAQIVCADASTNRRTLTDRDFPPVGVCKTRQAEVELADTIKAPAAHAF
jgi:hypothetical protein